MLHHKTQESQAFVLLKHMELAPETLTIPSETPFTLKISKNNSSSLSQCSEGTARKFIFLLEQTDEETPPLSEGDEYLFTIPLTEQGTYHLLCLNYTKIKCKIEVVSPPSEKSQTVEESSELKITISTLQMQNIVEVQQEKQEQTKEEVVGAPLQNSHSRSEYAEYQKILNDEDLHYDYMPNKYLKYFKEEFKLWRDFFEYEPEPQVPQKEKYGSQGPEKISSSSLSFSEKESEKEESVISHLRSHQEISDINEEELHHPKVMKKTNSEYCFNVEREVEKTHVSSNCKRRPFHTNTSSPNQRTQQSDTDTFLDWACGWAEEEGLDQIVLKKKGDKHLMKQWFTYLHNKFKITEFMFG